MYKLIDDFVKETSNNLEKASLAIVNYEKDFTNSKHADELAIILHTIKGACSFFAFNRLSKLIYTIETVISEFKDRKTLANTHNITLVIRAIERTQHLLTKIEQTGEETLGSDSDILTPLNQLITKIDNDNTSTTHTTKRVETDEKIDSSATETPIASPTDQGAPQPVTQSVSIPTDALDNLINTTFELLLARNKIENNEHIVLTTNNELQNNLQHIRKLTSKVYSYAMQTRMQPIGSLWRQLPIFVRNLAHSLNKKINLQISSQQTSIDCHVLKTIKDPIIQVIRNAIDYGIETTEQRKNLGKTPEGNISIREYKEASSMIIEITDDGQGITIDKIKKTAIAKGIVTSSQLNRMEHDQIYELMFKIGFTTKQQPTEISGKSIGMSTIKENIESIGGIVQLSSIPNQGTTIVMKVPLAIALAQVLVVQSSGTHYAIPQLAIDEIIQPKFTSNANLRYMMNDPVLLLRDDRIPIVSLSNLLQPNNSTDPTDRKVFHPDSPVVLVSIHENHIGILVDHILQTEEVSIKPFPSLLNRIGIFSGSATLSDGTVVLVIDPISISKTITFPIKQHPDTHELQGKPNLQNSTSTPVHLLLFHTQASTIVKAIPLSFIARIELLSTNAIKRVQEQNVVSCHGALIHLFDYDELSSTQQSPSNKTKKPRKLAVQNSQPMQLMTLIIAEQQRLVGLIVGEIIDVVLTNLDFEITEEHPEKTRTSMVNGVITEFVNIRSIFPLALENQSERINTQLSTASASQLILLVSNKSCCKTFRSTLQQCGFDIMTCKTATEVINLSNAGHQFNAIILKKNISDANILNFAKIIKESSLPDNTPLLIASQTRIPHEEMEKFYEVGFDNYILYTDSPTTLKETLNKRHRVASTPSNSTLQDSCRYLIFTVHEQFFALEITKIQAVFSPTTITKVPLAPPEIVGILNFHGDTVVAIDAYKLISHEASNPKNLEKKIAIKFNGMRDNYCLLVDETRDMLTFNKADLTYNLPNLERQLALIATGMYKHNNQLVLVLDTNSIIHSLGERHNYDKQELTMK